MPTSSSGPGMMKTVTRTTTSTRVTSDDGKKAAPPTRRRLVVLSSDDGRMINRSLISKYGKMTIDGSKEDGAGKKNRAAVGGVSAWTTTTVQTSDDVDGKVSRPTSTAKVVPIGKRRTTPIKVNTVHPVTRTLRTSTSVSDNFSINKYKDRRTQPVAKDKMTPGPVLSRTFKPKSSAKSGKTKSANGKDVQGTAEPQQKVATQVNNNKNSCVDGTREFEEECLKWHNIYRDRHNVPPLKLSDELCDFAQEWAERLAKEDKLQHRTDLKYGENIFMNYSSDPNFKVNGKHPVESWYSEIKLYKSYGTESRASGTGHFTQVVWKGSTQVGMGVAKSKSGKNFVVANYDPPGNMLGSFVENVLKPIKDISEE